MPAAAPASLHDRAAENLRFIRDTMTGASSFTAVSGAAGVCMGVSAIATAWAAGPPRDAFAWLAWWLGDAAIASAVGLVLTVRKANRTGVPLTNASARRFTLAFLPPVIAGALLTPVLFGAHLTSSLPGAWLLLYGAAVTGAGASSIRLVPMMGACLMGLGAASLWLPADSGALMMAAGFGGLQVGFGLAIARKHGG